MDVFEEGISKSYEPIKDIGSRVGFERGRVGRVKVSPSELAAYNLYKVLEKYPEYTKEARGQIQNYYKDFDGLETMNLPIFASVLSFLKRYPNPSPDSFKDENIMEFFINFIPEDAQDKKRLVTRLKAQFLKYIVAIKTYQSEKEEIFEEAEIAEGEREYEYGEEYGEEEYEEYEEEDEYSE